MKQMREEKRTGSFSSDTFEDIVDEGVKNGHRLVGDTSIRVDLLEDYTSCILISFKFDTWK